MAPMTDLSSVLFHNPTNSGAGHYIKQMELMNRLSDEDVTVYHVSPEGFDEVDSVTHLADTQTDIGVGVGFVMHLLSVLIALEKHRPNAFVSFNLFGGVVGALAKKRGPDLRTVLFVRGDTISGMEMSDALRHRIYSRLARYVERFIFRNVDHVVFISEENRDRMLERAGVSATEEDASVLYNNVFTERVEEQLKQEPRDLNGYPVLGFACGFPADEGKGLKYLICAVAELEKQFPDIQLYLLGKGPNRETLERFCREHGVEDRVYFTGWVNDPIRYMMSFDLYVLPSLHEGLGNSLLEALACETPIAGTDVGGIPEVVGAEQYLFEPESAAGIVSVVEEIFADESSYRACKRHAVSQREKFDLNWDERAMDVIRDG